MSLSSDYLLLCFISRLVSGYNEKLHGNNQAYIKSLGRHILRQYQPQLPAQLKNKGEGTLFQVKTILKLFFRHSQEQ